MNHITPRGNRLIPPNWRSMARRDPVGFASMYCVPYRPLYTPDGSMVFESGMFEEPSGKVWRRSRVVDEVRSCVETMRKGGTITYRFAPFADHRQAAPKLFIHVLELYCAATGDYKIHDEVSRWAGYGESFAALSKRAFRRMRRFGWNLGGKRGMSFRVFNNCIVVKDKRPIPLRTGAPFKSRQVRGGRR
jgi:hypothetical protein